MPKVSIITPTYNAAEFIGATIESVISQTFTDWELIIVDDGSTDATVTVAQQYARQHQDRIQVHSHTHTGLPSVTRNAAIYVAQGELLAFLDGDDVWEKNKLSHAVQLFSQDSGLAMIATGATIIGIGSHYPMPRPAGRVQFRSLTHNNCIITSTVVVRRSVINRVGIQNTDPKLFGYEDYELWLRLSSRANVQLVDQTLTRYRQNPQGISLTIGKGATDLQAKKYMFQQLLKTNLNVFQNLYIRLVINRINRQIATMSSGEAPTSNERPAPPPLPKYHLGCG
ncbi:MAG: glycosyltransferase [Patescibacteria group bacterium]